MSEVLFRLTITTLDVAEGMLQLDHPADQILRERFGFGSPCRFLLSWTGDEPSEAEVEGGYLISSELTNREDLVFQRLEFIYEDRVVIGVLLEDPEAEIAVKSAIMFRSLQLIASRIHRQIQAELVEIGNALGYDSWVAEGDRGAVRMLLPGAAILDSFPSVTHVPAANQVAKLIDVVFVPREPNQVPQFFEVESTTTIYSGLLRLNDVFSWRKDVLLHIVAHHTRRPKFDKEVSRPSFFSIRGSVIFLSFEEIHSWRRKVLAGKTDKT